MEEKRVAVVYGWRPVHFLGTGGDWVHHRIWGWELQKEGTWRKDPQPSTSSKRLDSIMPLTEQWQTSWLWRCWHSDVTVKGFVGVPGWWGLLLQTPCLLCWQRLSWWCGSRSVNGTLRLMRVGIGSLPKQVFTHTHNFSAHFCQCLILCIVKTKKSSTPLKEPGIFLQFGESLPLHLKLVAIGVGPIFFFSFTLCTTCSLLWSSDVRPMSKSNTR